MNAVRLLEERHMVTILRYVAEHEGCLKTDVYRDVSHSGGMSGKLDALADAGLLRAEGREDRLMRRYTLTDVGAEALRAIEALDGVLSRGRL